MTSNPSEAAPATDSPTTYQAQIQRNLRWNMTVNIADGAFFWLAMSFAGPSTVMPLYVSHLTDSALLIGLVAGINNAGWYLPQLLTVGYVERLPVKKRMVINLGLFSERLPLLLMTLTVFAFAGRRPDVALALFFLTLTWHTLGAGAEGVPGQGQEEESQSNIRPSAGKGKNGESHEQQGQPLREQAQVDDHALLDWQTLYITNSQQLRQIPAGVVDPRDEANQQGTVREMAHIQGHHRARAGKAHREPEESAVGDIDRHVPAQVALDLGLVRSRAVGGRGRF